MHTKFLVVSFCIFTLHITAYSDALNDLDRGHRLIIEHGLQLQALVLDNEVFDAQTWADSNYTTVNFWAIPNVALFGDAPGIPWARWFGGHDVIADMDLPPEEMPYLSNLISMQAGDEQDLTDPIVAQNTADIYTYWRQHYPDQIHMLSQMLKNMSEVEPHIDTIQPDLIAGGSYRLNNVDNYITEPIHRGGSPQKMYKELLMLRELCLQGHAGSNGNSIPYGIYTQLFYQMNDGDYELIVSESQMRLQLMAAWALGCKWICGFIYNNKFSGGVANGDLYPVLFGEGGDWTAPTERFYQSAQLNTESLNLGPALIRLVSTDVRIVSGRYINPTCLPSMTPCELEIPLPAGMQAWTSDADPYITAITQTNLSTINDGLPGDILVGYFQPLHEEFDGANYTDEIYFMIVNSMAFQEASCAETQQQIDIDFDFSGTDITSLQRLSRTSGMIETVPLTFIASNQYRLTLSYDGGEGDLYKFNTGAPFILSNSPDSDGDGHVDAEDIFPYNPDEWADADMDGLGDNFEQIILDYSLSDGFDVLEDVFPEHDFDHDGVSNQDEFHWNMDPTDGASQLSLSSISMILMTLLAVSFFAVKRPILNF